MISNDTVDKSLNVPPENYYLKRQVYDLTEIKDLDCYSAGKF